MVEIVRVVEVVRARGARSQELGVRMEEHSLCLSFPDSGF